VTLGAISGSEQAITLIVTMTMKILMYDVVFMDVLFGWSNLSLRTSLVLEEMTH
jgi:hypothetical protein